MYYQLGLFSIPSYWRYLQCLPRICHCSKIRCSESVWLFVYLLNVLPNGNASADDEDGLFIVCLLQQIFRFGLNLRLSEKKRIDESSSNSRCDCLCSHLTNPFKKSRNSFLNHQETWEKNSHHQHATMADRETSEWSIRLIEERKNCKKS